MRSIDYCAVSLVLRHHVILSVDHLMTFMPSLVACYKVVFRGPPYGENHDGKENENIIEQFLNFARRGVVVLVTIGLAELNDDRDNVVVGFGASISANLDQSVSVFLEENNHYLAHPISKYLYMAELGVLSPFRNRGIGKLLIRARIDAARENPNFGCSHYVMKTARKGSMSLPLYLKFGAKPIDGLIQKSNFGDCDPEASDRMFLAGSF